jgi:nucleotide-binding universal stress UspA family protein
MTLDRSSAWATDPELREFNQAVARAAARLPRQPQRRIYRQVLVAYNGTDYARDALACVPAVVSDETDVTVITVIAYEAVGSSLDPIKEELRQWQWNCSVEATAYLRSFGIDPYVEAAVGTPAAVIRETALSLEADLVILGNGRRRGWHPSIKRQRVRPSLQRQLGCDILIARNLERQDIEPSGHG